MKLVSRLAIALFIFLSGVLALISAVPVQAAGPTIALSRSSSYVGSEVYLSGTGFDYYAGQRLYIRYKVNSDYETLEKVRIKSDGTFISDELEIPESCKGEHRIGIDNNVRRMVSAEHLR